MRPGGSDPNAEATDRVGCVVLVLLLIVFVTCAILIFSFAGMPYYD